MACIHPHPVTPPTRETENMPHGHPRIGPVLTRALDACHLPVAFYLAYAGTLALLHGPGQVLSTLPAWLSYAWATALVIGALLTFYGTLLDHNRAESAGHGFHLFGLGLYALTAYLAIGMSGSLVVVVLTLGGVSASRLRLLSRSRKGKQVAGLFLEGGQ